MEDKKNSVKKFWADHKTKILTATTVISIAGAALMKVGLNQHDNFLKEHDLYDEFYNPED